MSENIKISNGKLDATICTRGAELISLISNGREVIWQADPAVWAKHCPNLFPICGGLRDDKFIFEGKEYTLPKHGYAATTEFSVEKKTDNSVTFLHTSNEETLKIFPFTYELRIIYTLNGADLKVDYNVKNIGNGDMYFSIGAHEGYSCPGGLKNYTICFEKDEDFMATPVCGPLLMHEEHQASPAGRELPLKDELFVIDALVFCNANSKSAYIKENATGKVMAAVDFHGFNQLLIWTKPGAEYVCIEPWCGIPDYTDSDYDITKKPGILKLAAGEIAEKTHIVTVEE